MDISVVLCTYNNAERLRITLQSLCRLNQPQGLDWELVAVNNNSTDDTETVIKSFDDQLPIRYVYEPEQGVSRARNAGLDVAEGELIVFTDDDVKPNPEWLTAYWEAYQERPEGYYFGGPVESEHEGEPPDEELLEIAMASVSGLDYGSESGRLDSNDKFLGANWACPAVHLRRVGKFNEGLGLNASASNVSVGEETDMMIQLENIGIKKWYVSRAKLKHYVPEEKCSLDHIARRRIAEEMENRRSNKEKPKDLCGFPIGIYKTYIYNAAKYILCRVLGGKGIEERFEMERWRRRINNF